MSDEGKSDGLLIGILVVLLLLVIGGLGMGGFMFTRMARMREREARVAAEQALVAQQARREAEELRAQAEAAQAEAEALAKAAATRDSGNAEPSAAATDSRATKSAEKSPE
jgi:uncharacterized protein HemX